MIIFLKRAAMIILYIKTSTRHLLNHGAELDVISLTCSFPKGIDIFKILNICPDYLKLLHVSVTYNRETRFADCIGFHVLSRNGGLRRKCLAFCDTAIGNCLPAGVKTAASVKDFNLKWINRYHIITIII